jgi:hypothetical protein
MLVSAQVLRVTFKKVELEVCSGPPFVPKTEQKKVMVESRRMSPKKKDEV